MFFAYGAMVLIWPAFSNWGDMHRWSTFTELNLKHKQDLFLTAQSPSKYLLHIRTVKSEYCLSIEVMIIELCSQFRVITNVNHDHECRATLTEVTHTEGKLTSTWSCTAQCAFSKHHCYALHMGHTILGNELI